MSTTLPAGRRFAGFSIIFWKIQGCEERRAIFKRIRGSGVTGIVDSTADMEVSVAASCFGFRAGAKPKAGGGKIFSGCSECGGEQKTLAGVFRSTPTSLPLMY